MKAWQSVALLVGALLMYGSYSQYAEGNDKLATVQTFEQIAASSDGQNPNLFNLFFNMAINAVGPENIEAAKAELRQEARKDHLRAGIMAYLGGVALFLGLMQTRAATALHQAGEPRGFEPVWHALREAHWQGQVNRATYIYFFLITISILLGAIALDWLVFDDVFVLFFAVCGLLLLPSLSVTRRRLNHVGSGTVVFFVWLALTIINAILSVVVWYSHDVPIHGANAVSFGWIGMLAQFAVSILLTIVSLILAIQTLRKGGRHSSPQPAEATQ
jgi:uncharacterized membrane protein YhaH (DUF805 family)